MHACIITRCLCWRFYPNSVIKQTVTVGVLLPERQHKHTLKIMHIGAPLRTAGRHAFLFSLLFPFSAVLWGNRLLSVWLKGSKTTLVALNTGFKEWSACAPNKGTSYRSLTEQKFLPAISSGNVGAGTSSVHLQPCL